MNPNDFMTPEQMKKQDSLSNDAWLVLTNEIHQSNMNKRIKYKSISTDHFGPTPTQQDFLSRTVSQPEIYSSHNKQLKNFLFHRQLL